VNKLQAIDREVKGIVETSHQQALDILSATETCWRRLQLETEVIEGEELQNLLSQVKSGTQAHPEVSLAEV